MIFELVHSNLQDMRSKKLRNTSETNNLIRVPTIKVESDESSSKRIFLKTPPHKVNLTRLKTLQPKTPLKVLDFTDKLFKDIPKFSFAEALVSPKLKTKLISSIESPIFDETSGFLTKKPSKGCPRQKLLTNSPKRVKLKSKELDSEFFLEYQKKKYEARLKRSVSPWLFSGEMKKYSIFC